MIVLSAEIRVTQIYALDGFHPAHSVAEWIGGDTAAVSYEFLESSIVQRGDDKDPLDICGIKVQIVHDAPEFALVYVQRVSDK
jgi:hypothetical protein